MRLVSFNTKSIPLIIIIIGGIYIISCNFDHSKKKANENEEKVSMEIDIDVNNVTAFNIEEVGSLVKYIPLETKDEALIGTIDKLYLNDNVIIVFDRKNKNIFLFDQKGTFIRQIGTYGQGPREYLEFGDIYYDSRTNKIYCFERLKNKMFVYSLDGSIDKVIDSHFSFNSFIKVDKGYWIYGCFQNNPEKYQLIYADDNLSTIKKGFFPQTAFVNPMIETCFTEDSKGNKYFFYPSSNVIYKLNKDNVESFIALDFGSRGLPYNEIIKAKDDKEYDKIVQTTTNYVGFIENVHISETKCIFNCQESGLYMSKKTFNIWINLDNKQAWIFDKYHNTPGSPTLNHLLFISDGNELVYAINPLTLMGREIEEAQKIIPSLSEDSNPVLVLYNIKQ
jgi:hypothetical protein